MYWRDHAPPHFHAKYKDDEVTVEIMTGIVSGKMSSRAISMIQEWRMQYRDELILNWELAEEKKAINPIKPLE